MRSGTDPDIQNEIYWHWVGIAVERLGEKDEKSS